MKREMNLLEKESLYLVSTNLQNCSMQTNGGHLDTVVSKLRDCYWRNDANEASIDGILADLRESKATLRKMHRSLEESICCLDAIVNSIENRLYDNDAQS